MKTAEQTFDARDMRRWVATVSHAAMLLLLVAGTDASWARVDAGEHALARPLAATQADGIHVDASKTTATEGFVAEVLDVGVQLRWQKDPDATGYNVYRQGEYYTTVFDNEFLDTDRLAQQHAYQIIAFEKHGSKTRFYTIADGLVVSIPSKSLGARQFESTATAGFKAYVLNDSILVSWTADSAATGYNVYRQGQYYATVFDTKFHDKEVPEQNYTYQITAFEKRGQDTRYYSIATGLTVSVSARPVRSGYFESPVTADFVGQVLGKSILISWNRKAAATGYNVYRQGQYYTTVFDTKFHDTDVQAQSYSYQITAFEKNAQGTHFFKIADGLTVTLSAVDTNGPVVPVTDSDSDSSGSGGSSGAGGSNAPANVQTGNTGSEPVAASASPVGTTYFKSPTTEGFTADVEDDGIRIRWNRDSQASGYNVYRQAEYLDTVFTNEFMDLDVYDQDYYYEIQAFEHRQGADTRYYPIATGLTVAARTLGRLDPDRPMPNDELLKDYELVFADEFNGDSLDASKWNTSFLWGTDLVINGEEQYYVDILKEPDFGFDPFTFDGSHLTINTIKTPPELAGKSIGQPYLSGIITSYDAFKFTYGYAEVRAKMTHGRGYWPAFWLLNAYYGGEDPEIDIMEFVGDNQDVVYHTFHYHDENGKLRSTQSKPTPGIDYTADFHTFAVEWKPGTIIYYVDGVEAHRITDPKVPREQMYLIANTAVGGWWAGSPDASTPFPGKYMIDYIRVYQKAVPYNDFLFSDAMSGVPLADDIPDEVSPNHRPTRDQWPEGYPYD